MARQKRWTDLSPAQKTGVIILGAIQITLLIAALWDIRQRPAEAINGSKTAWTLISFINFFGPLAYFVLGRKNS